MPGREGLNGQEEHMNDAMPVVAARPIVLDFKPLLRKLDNIVVDKECWQDKCSHISIAYTWLFEDDPGGLCL
jgi:hypothetical protein